MSTILVIDDNPSNRETFADVLTSDGHQVLTAASGEEGLAKMTSTSIDCVLCDLRLPHLDGLGVMELAHERHGKVPWVLVTGHGSDEVAVNAIKQGAFNYLTKPVDLARLKATIASAVRMAQATRENRQLRRDLGYEEALERIVGSSPAIRQMKALIRQVAPTDAIVLIDGESGTGKELVADAVHALSNRSSRPYLKINTAAIPRELLESALFGHERGAFTGAVAQKKGTFEAADGGTLFLDEIGEMPLDSQVKLLRVLQDGTFHRVGGNQTLAVDVRLVCATNRDLKAEVLAGRFRMDLFYRLNVVNIHVPALRERREDIPLMARTFVDRLNRKHHHDKTLGDSCLTWLRKQPWTGNVRELENAIERMFIMTPAKVIEADAVQVLPGAPSDDEPSIASTRQPISIDEAVGRLIGLGVGDVERRLIIATLAHCEGNKTRAARMLNIGTKTLYRKLEEYGLGSAPDGPDPAQSIPSMPPT